MLEISKWLNTNDKKQIDINDGSIKFIHFFQMLCPGCVYYGIPQTIDVFHDYKNIKVFAVHSVFENHSVMTEEALEVFIKEWKFPFPVGIDRHEDGNWMPETMKKLNLQGTPSTVILDENNKILLKHFGHFETNRLKIFLDNLSRRAV